MLESLTDSLVSFNKEIAVIVLAALPISELRGAIPLGIGMDCAIHGGADFDGDLICTINNDIIKNLAVSLRHIHVPPLVSVALQKGLDFFIQLLV